MTWARATFRRRLLPPGRRDVALHSLRHARAPSRATVAGCGDASCGAARRSRPRGDAQPAAARRRRSQHLLPGNWYKTSPNQFECSHSKNTRRTSTVVLEYPWHRYGMALCFFLVLVRVVVLIPGMFNSLCDVFYLLFERFLVYQSLSSKIPPYDSENPGYLRVSSLVQAGTPNSTPQTPHRGYLLPEAMIGQFLPQELSLSCGGRRESEHRRR